MQKEHKINYDKDKEVSILIDQEARISVLAAVSELELIWSSGLGLEGRKHRRSLSSRDSALVSAARRRRRHLPTVERRHRRTPGLLPSRPTRHQPPSSYRGPDRPNSHLSSCRKYRADTINAVSHRREYYSYELLARAIRTRSSYECLFTLSRTNVANTRARGITYVILMSLDVACGRLLALVMLQIS